MTTCPVSVASFVPDPISSFCIVTCCNVSVQSLFRWCLYLKLLCNSAVLVSACDVLRILKTVIGVKCSADKPNVGKLGVN